MRLNRLILASVKNHRLGERSTILFLDYIMAGIYNVGNEVIMNWEKDYVFVAFSCFAVRVKTGGSRMTAKIVFLLTLFVRHIEVVYFE